MRGLNATESPGRVDALLFSKGLVRGSKSEPPPEKRDGGVSGQWLHSGQYQGDASSYSSAVVFAQA